MSDLFVGFVSGFAGAIATVAAIAFLAVYGPPVKPLPAPFTLGLFGGLIVAVGVMWALADKYIKIG